MPRTAFAAPATTIAIVCAVAIGTSRPVAAADKQKPKATPIVLTGCLGTDGSRYVLTAVRGVNAPASVQVVGAVPAMKLNDHVARQVTVTGLSTGQSQITARAIRQVSPYCS